MRPSSASRIAASAEQRHRLRRPAVERELDRRQPEADRQHGHRAGQDDAVPAAAFAAGLDHGSSASTVSPPIARWPDSTSTVGAVRAGRCPGATRSGSAHRSRRAAACRRSWRADDAAGQQPGDLYDRDVDAARCPNPHAVAFVLRAGPVAVGRAELARPVARPPSTSPATGTRCTCASNSDKKMLIRVIGVSGRPSSAGGAAWSIRVMRPSAGATTTPGRVGRHPRRMPEEQRAGPRGRPAPPVRSHRWRRPTAARPSPPATNGRPAGCIGGTVDRTSSISRGASDLRSSTWRVARVWPSALDSTGGTSPGRQVPHRNLRTGGHLDDVFVDLQQTVRRRQPTQVMRRRRAVAGDLARGVQHAAALPRVWSIWS